MDKTGVGKLKKKRGGGLDGSDDPFFWGVNLYISYTKCEGRGQCKKNLFRK